VNGNNEQTATAQPLPPIRVGALGLGRAFTLMLPTLSRDSRVNLVAAFDPAASACAKFSEDFGGRVQASPEALFADNEVELVYIATPHQMHAAHVALAAAAGKHVLLEKPMAITLADCNSMIAAMQAAERQLIVGPSHSFDAPVLKARAIIESGELGRVRMITALNFTDFLYRPRRPEELQTEQGGGVVHSQAAHQLDVVRLLGGGLVKSVRAHTGQWDDARPTEGAYSAMLTFADGAFATLTYSGYAHFDSDEWMGWQGELGAMKNPDDYGAARRRLAANTNPNDEARAKANRNYGGSNYVAPPAPATHEHFGPVIVSCERGDLRLMPDGVWVYGNDVRRFEPTPITSVPRREVIDELWAVLRNGRRPQHDGAWARATTEASLAILESAKRNCEVQLHQQVPWQR
jgi:phthalate 4,5-cis-dihydrodiol dehydrogenase